MSKDPGTTLIPVAAGPFRVPGAAVAGAALTLLMLPCAALLVSTGDYRAIALGVIVVGFFGSLTAMLLLPARRGQVGLRTGPEGTTFPLSRLPRRRFARACWWFALGPVGPLLQILSGTGDTIELRYPSLLLLGPVVTWAALRELRAQPLGGLTVSVCGLTAVTPRGTARLVWDQVRPDPGGSRPLAGMLRDGVRGFPDVGLDSDRFAVAKVVEFYRSNPRARRELHRADRVGERITMLCPPPAD